MKITKKHIGQELRSQDPTRIFKLAAMCGIDTANKCSVFKFVKSNAPTQRIMDLAFHLTIDSNWKNQAKSVYGMIDLPIHKAITFARMQKNNGWLNTSYGKILIEGANNIYWASPIYGHSDYNKSVAFNNTEHNRRVADLVNSFLSVN